MPRELRCPHCGEPSFTAMQFVQAGLFRSLECSICGKTAGPTTRFNIVFIAITTIVGAGMTLIFFLVERPLDNPEHRMTRWEMLQRPTTWVLLVAGWFTFAWLYARTLRIERR